MSTTIIKTIAAIYRKDKWSMNKSVSSDISIYKQAQQWVEKIGKSCTDVRRVKSNNKQCFVQHPQTAPIYIFLHVSFSISHITSACCQFDKMH